jgi:putative transposase
VKHGLVARVKDRPYSSFHGMVRLGISEDWAGGRKEDDADRGER